VHKKTYIFISTNLTKICSIHYDCLSFDTTQFNLLTWWDTANENTTSLVTDSKGKNSEKNRNVLVVKFWLTWVFFFSIIFLKRKKTNYYNLIFFSQREPPTMGKQHSTVSLFRKKVFNLRKFSKNTASEYLCGIFKPSIETYFHYVHDLFYM
jgi:hypothetical protein